VWIDKGLTIKKSTLLKIKTVNKKIIHYSPDDMLNPRNQSKRYLNCISIYDLHVTTKSYNVSELLANGALKSYFINIFMEEYIINIIWDIFISIKHI
jgi:hypothetical protein